MRILYDSSGGGSAAKKKKGGYRAYSVGGVTNLVNY